MRSRSVWIAGALTAAMLVAACGSSSKSSSTATTSNSGSGTSAGGAAKPTGTPIKLGIIVPIQSTVVSEPWISQAAKIGVAAVNADGGIDGRPLQLFVCDDMYTPQGAALCAQKLLNQDKVLMLVGDDGTQDSAVDPIVQAAGTISWGDYGASLASYSAPSAYILDPSLVATWVLPRMFPPNTQRITYVSADAAIALASEKNFLNFVPKSIHASTVVVPETATSMETTCLQIKSSSPQVVIPEAVPAQAAPMMNSCYQLGLRATWVTGSVQVGTDVLQTVTKLNLPNAIAVPYSGKAYTDYQADINKYGSQVGGITNPIQDPAVGAWMAVKLLPAVIAGAGSLNPKTIQTWLNQQSAFNTDGYTLPIDFAATPLPQFPRLKNMTSYKAGIQNEQLVQTDPNPFTYTPGS